MNDGIMSMAFEDVARFNLEMSELSVLSVIGFLIWTLHSIGRFYDKHESTWTGELPCCVTFLVVYDG